MPSQLESFENFLSGIDLEDYKDKYSRIKIVELDLDREIQAIPAIYRNYWERGDNWPSFEEFYVDYEKDVKDDLEIFRAEKQFSKETFYRGLPARIYRTWASLITQIQGGYVCKEIYGTGNVEMSAELDWQGIDFRIKDGNKYASVQVKKITQNVGGLKGLTRVANQIRQIKRRGQPISLFEYAVAPPRYTRVKGDIRGGFLVWEKKYKGKLKLLDNGFVVFEKGAFDKKHLIFV